LCSPCDFLGHQDWRHRDHHAFGPADATDADADANAHTDATDATDTRTSIGWLPRRLVDCMHGVVPFLAANCV
jgi:hypothetical protein